VQDRRHAGNDTDALLVPPTSRRTHEPSGDASCYCAAPNAESPDSPESGGPKSLGQISSMSLEKRKLFQR
jgi:hypothetical protein